MPNREDFNLETFSEDLDKSRRVKDNNLRCCTRIDEDRPQSRQKWWRRTEKKQLENNFYVRTKKSSSGASVRVDEEWETFGQFEKSSYWVCRVLTNMLSMLPRKIKWREKILFYSLFTPHEHFHTHFALLLLFTQFTITNPAHTRTEWSLSRNKTFAFYRFSHVLSSSPVSHSLSEPFHVVCYCMLFQRTDINAVSKSSER